MVQEKDTLNKKQSLPCWSWCHGPLFFLRWFLRFVLIFLLHHSGKITILRNRLFLLLQILNLIIFKLLQRQGDLNTSGDIRAVFSWDRDGYHHLSFMRRSDLPFFWNRFVAIFFYHYFQKVVLLVLQQCVWGLRSYWWQVNIFIDIGMCHWPHRWCKM